MTILWFSVGALPICTAIGLKVQELLSEEEGTLCPRDANWIVYKRCCSDVAFICDEHLHAIKQPAVFNECRACKRIHCGFDSFIARVEPL